MAGFALLFALVAFTACKSGDSEPQAGSETNFLSRCDATCEAGLSCLCGVCTRACTGADECAQLASGSKCVSVPENPDAGNDGSCQRGATCDFTCTRDTDCESLGADYGCEAGYCRRGQLRCVGKTLKPGHEVREIVVGGSTRAYTLHVPANYTGTTPVPLVLDFHPMALGADWEAANSGYQSLADQEGFIVAFPHGLDNTWNIGPCCSTQTVDDYAFASAVVRQLSVEACIEPSRIHAVGFSMGGAMAYYLACKHAEVFASIAVSSMDLFADSQITCEPSRAVAEISYRSMDDSVVPYAGGTSNPPGYPQFSNELLGATGTFQKWAALDGCSGTPSAQDASGCSTYSSCRDGTQVTLCTTQTGGQIMGDANSAWRVLKAHPMP